MKLIVDRILKLKTLCQTEEQISSQTDLSLKEARILEFLNQKAAATNLDVAEHLKLSPSRCSRIVDRLVQQKYLTRVATKTDRRYVSLKLNQKGQDMLPLITQAKEKCELQLSSSISAKERKEILHGLDILIEKLQNPVQENIS